MMKRTSRIARFAPLAASIALTSSSAYAFDIPMRAHAEGSAAHFLGLGGAWQGREIGTGTIGSGALELAITRRIGIEGRLTAGRFLDGQPPLDASLHRTENAGLFGYMGGLRFQPFDDDGGLWIGAAAGKITTGDLKRTVFDARIGWDFRLGNMFRGGPFVGYMHIVQPNDGALRPEDGRVAMLGLHLAFDDIKPIVTSTPSEKKQKDDGPKPAPVVAKAPEAPKPEESKTPPGVGVNEPFVPDCTVDPYQPDCTPPTAVVSGDSIVISDHIHFDVNSPNLTIGSDAILETVARTILDHPEIELVEIDGHTDDLGSDEWNQKLSVSRAEAVRAALVHIGVAESRLVVRGFGKSQPLVSGNDEASRKKNRRVEFVIQRRTAK